METFDLPYERFRETFSFPVAVSTSEDGVEQRRLITNKRVREFNLTSPNLTQVSEEAYFDFYVARKGELEEFLFELPGSGGTIKVRFNGALSRSFSRGVWRLEFAFIYVPETEEL